MARVRTFLAVELAPSVRARCAELQAALSEAAENVNWVEEANLHVTLLFLGEVEDRDLPGVCRAVSEVAGRFGPFALAAAGVRCFGDPRRPRTIWAGVGEGAAELAELHDALEARLQQLGCYRREERGYTPHITLGRARGDRPNEALAQALADHAGWSGGECAVGRVVVMSSELTRRGPVYAVMSKGKLGG